MYLFQQSNGLRQKRLRFLKPPAKQSLLSGY